MADSGYEKVEFSLSILDIESRESERVEREREGGGGRGVGFTPMRCSSSNGLPNFHSSIHCLKMESLHPFYRLSNIKGHLL